MGPKIAQNHKVLFTSLPYRERESGGVIDCKIFEINFSPTSFNSFISNIFSVLYTSQLFPPSLMYSSEVEEGLMVLSSSVLESCCGGDGGSGSGDRGGSHNDDNNGSALL